MVPAASHDLHSSAQHMHLIWVDVVQLVVYLLRLPGVNMLASTLRKCRPLQLHRAAHGCSALHFCLRTDLHRVRGVECRFTSTGWLHGSKHTCSDPHSAIDAVVL